MKDFLLIYRNNSGGMPAVSPEEMQAITKSWMDWLGSVAAQNKLTDRGNRLVEHNNVGWQRWPVVVPIRVWLVADHAFAEGRHHL